MAPGSRYEKISIDKKLRLNGDIEYLISPSEKLKISEVYVRCTEEELYY
jgi:hypothetical protein